MPTSHEKPNRKALGTVGNIMILERELGKLAYRVAKLQEKLASANLSNAEDAGVRAELDALEDQRPKLIKLLDAENRRLNPSEAR